MKQLHYSFLLFIFFILFACSKNTSTSVTYDVTDATVRSFALAAQDSFPGLGAAVFEVDDRLDTGLIAPKDGDSLLYGTSLHRVVPKVTFNSRPSAAIYYVGDTSFIYTGYDTIDLTQSPVYLRVYAANRKDEKYYRIEAYAHSIDPYLYHIDTLQTQMVSPARTTYVLHKNGMFYAFLTDGYTVRLTQSADAASWSEEQAVTGLPAHAVIRQIVVDSVSSDFCYLADQNLYRSKDGLTWTAASIPFPQTPFNIEATLFAFANRLWFAVTASEDTFLANYDTDNGQVEIMQAVPSDFPVSDFATAVFRSVSGFPTALIQGGFDHDGQMSANCWSLEKTNNAFRLLNLHTSHYAQPAIAGATLVNYANRLIRFGGLSRDGNMNGVYESYSEGLTFVPADTTHLPVPKDFAPRYRQSAIVLNDYIYLIGGQDHTKHYADVYRVRLNTIGW
jgi:hypothetical protein